MAHSRADRDWPADVEILTGVPAMQTIDGHYEPAPFYLTADSFGGMPSRGT
jgi:hypothetical protein